jgi:NDP-sugar pyrophosphorylase family protein
MKDGHRVHGYQHEGYWLDIGRHEDYEAANNGWDALKPILFSFEQDQIK